MDRISISLIDKARTMCEPPTDYQLAKRLHISHATISRCRHRRGTLDNEAATRLAELLGQEPYDVIAVMELERAKDPKKRAFWESKLPRIVPVVAYLGIITGVTQFTSSEAKGLTTVSQLIHYAQLFARWAVSRWHMLRQTGFALGLRPRMVYKVCPELSFRPL